MKLPDFDTLAAMTDKERTELKRKMVQDMMDRDPERAQRIASMQWRIDKKIERSNDPLNAIFSDMWSKFEELNEALKTFRSKKVK
jgi:hypothetical protein